MAEEEPQIKYTTAFAVLQDLDGMVHVVPALEEESLHPPTPGEILMLSGYVHEFVKEEVLHPKPAPKKTLQDKLAERRAEADESL